MKRREFFRDSGFIGGACLLAPVLSRSEEMSKDESVQSKLERVKMAMLSMQRASWEQGVVSQSFLESGDERMTILMAKEAVLRQTEEGRLGVVYSDNGNTDPGSCGEAVLFAASKTKDPILKQGADRMLDYFSNKALKTESGILLHTLDSPEIWVDSLYMAPPFLAAAGQFDEAVKQVKGIRDFLWNPGSHLFSHRWHVEKKEFVNAKFWGVGNGWAMAGMSRVLAKLPPSMESEKKELIQYITETLEGCLKHVRSDYLFHNIIDDPSTFIETNLSQMTAYTIFRGVSEKWLASDYLPAAKKMRNAAHQKVDEFGYVQDVCGAPFFESPGRATEGQAFFILMESAYRRLEG